MKYAIEIALNRIIPKEIKSIIATQRTLDILIDGVAENFVVIPMDEMLEVYKEQENLFDYDVIPFAILDDDYLCLYYQNNGISIIYWSSERALESKNMAIFQLYSSYEDFVKDCITTKHPHGQA